MSIDAELRELPQVTVGRARPVLPSEDPFYVPPREFAAFAPGTVIRSRNVRIAAFGIIPQKVHAVQFLYRSTDLDGKPDAAVTTVLWTGEFARTAGPILAFQCAIDATTSRGFPSYILQHRARMSASIVPIELLFAGNALRRGWTVVITDHEGIEGRFGAPREPGYRVLDGVRATINEFGLDPDTKVAAWGYSGGGMATSWVAEMAPSYAPEINLIGAVLGAPVGDPHSAFWRLNGSFHAGLAVLVIASLRRKYPGLISMVHNHVTLAGRRRLEQADAMSTVGAVLRYAFDNFDDYVDGPLAELLKAPDIEAMFEDLRLGMHKPACPLLVIQPVHDQIIAAQDVDGQVGRYLRHGADVTYIRDRLSEHLSAMPLSVPTAIDWIDARFAGAPTQPGTTTVWTMATQPRGVASMILTTLRMLVGLPVRFQYRLRGPSALPILRPPRHKFLRRRR